MTRLYACRLEVYVAGSSTASSTNLAHGTRPHGTPPDISAIESTDTMRASDVGFRDLSDGIYPPLLERAFEIDRAITLAPGADAVGSSWGTLTLLNPGGIWDGVTSSRSCDGRPVTILTGKKVYDHGRGIWLDPPADSLTTVLQCIAKGWFPNETALEVPLTDASYWLDRPLQNSFYLGSGGYSGGTTLAGVPIPKARGGTNTAPIPNVSPVLIDAANLVYQYNDGPGTVVALYEGAAQTYGYGGDTTDLYANPPNPGQYRTDNSRGLFRLGTSPKRPITADVTGAFPVAGVKTTAADIALEILREDAGIPAAYIDADSFTTLAAFFPWTSGYYFGPQSTNAGAAASLFLRAIGAKLIPTRTGKLRAVALRALAPGTTPAATLTTGEVVDVVPLALREPLDPPADLWRIGWGRNHTVQTSDLSEQIADARRPFVVSEWRISAALVSAVNAAYSRPSRPDIVQTALLTQEHADLLTAAIVGLWGVRRRLYAVDVPISIGLARDIGDVVRLVYPLDDLRSGRLGIVVGEQYRSGDSIMTMQVLV